VEKAVEVPKKGLTLKVIVFMVLWIALLAWWNFDNEGSRGIWASRFMDYEWVYAIQTSLGQVFLFVGIVSLINRYKRILSRQELAMLLILLPLCNMTYQAAHEPDGDYYFFGPGVSFMSEAWQRRLVPLFEGNPLFPRVADKTFWTSVITGGWSPKAASIAPSVPWDAWASVMAWNSLLRISSVFLGFALALFLRRGYVDVEGLPFPLGDIYMMIEDQGESITLAGKVKGVVLNKYFMLAFLASFGWYFLIYPADLFWLFTGNPVGTPGLMPRGGIWGTPGGTGGILEFDVSALGIAALPWVALLLDPQVHYVGWSLLLSLEVLTGVVVGWVIFYLILPMAMYGAGGILPPWVPGTGSPTGTIFRSYWDAWNRMALAPFVWGFLIALVFIPLWRNKSIFGPIFKSITGAKVSKDVDPDPPLSYPKVWILFIVSVVMLIGIGVWVWMPWYAVALWVLIPIIIFGLGSARSTSEGGGWFGMPYYIDSWGGGFECAISWIFFTYLIIPAGLTAGGALFRNICVTQKIGAVLYSLVGLTLGLTAFVIAKHANLDKKDVVKAFLIFVPLAAVSQSIWRVLMIHGIAFPQTSSYGTYLVTEGVTTVTTGITEIETKGTGYGWQLIPEKTIMTFIIGFVVCAALYFVKKRYPRIPISPVGLFVGINFASVMFIPALIALIVKYLMIRIGGAGLYQRIGRPVAIGLVLGFGVVYFMHTRIYNLYELRSWTGMWFPP